MKSKTVEVIANNCRSNKMKDELLSVIEKNLPAATAGVMKDFIADAENNKAKLKKQEKTISELQDTITKLQEELKGSHKLIRKQEEVDKLKQSLATLDTTLSERERNIDVTLLQLKLEMMTDRNERIERLVDKVFGHPSVTVSSCKDVALAVPGGGSCAGYVHKESSLAETVTTTKGKV